MRVVCVNHDRFGNDIPYGPTDPKIGDECTVIAECIGFDESGIANLAYELEGYDPYVYDQRNFAIVSDLDETELVTEEFNEKYCVPVKR